jgi:hypothetical protein
MSMVSLSGETAGRMANATVLGQAPILGEAKTAWSAFRDVFWRNALLLELERHDGERRQANH